MVVPTGLPLSSSAGAVESRRFVSRATSAVICSFVAPLRVTTVRASPSPVRIRAVCTRAVSPLST